MLSFVQMVFAFLQAPKISDKFLLMAKQRAKRHLGIGPSQRCHAAVPTHLAPASSALLVTYPYRHKGILAIVSHLIHPSLPHFVP